MNEMAALISVICLPVYFPLPPLSRKRPDLSFRPVKDWPLVHLYSPFRHGTISEFLPHNQSIGFGESLIRQRTAIN
jgi:hypothetical protein